MDIPQIEELGLLHANICQALGDPKRIQILYALHGEPRYVSALAEDLGMPQPTVSRHLQVLRQRSLVLTERDGQTVVYRLADARIIDVLNMMRQIMRDALDRQTNVLA
jgi:ArsR family transcriptional regulator